MMRRAVLSLSLGSRGCPSQRPCHRSGRGEGDQKPTGTKTITSMRGTVSNPGTLKGNISRLWPARSL